MTNQESSMVDAQRNNVGTVYYRQRSIMLLAFSVVIAANDKTFQRPSIRLVIGLDDPVTLGFRDGSRQAYSAVLLSPDAGLCEVQAQNNNVVMLDVVAGTEEYVALQSYLDGRDRVVCEGLHLAPFRDSFPRGQSGHLSCDEVFQTIQRLVVSVTGTRIAPLELDHRVVTTLQMIEALPLSEINLATLSKAANLSSDRFRHLFKEVTGCTVSQYSRQTALWRALEQITNGSSVTEAAQTAGFHDVSHLYRAYYEVFGVSLSEKNNPRKFKRVRCFC